MQQKVILHSEQISRRGEIKYFQIPLQGTAIKIIAVEVSAFLFAPLNEPTSPPATAPTPVVETPPVTEPAPVEPAPTPTQFSNCPNPGTAEITQVSSTDNGSVRTEVYKIGPAVNPGFTFSVALYSYNITVTAVDGELNYNIAARLAGIVNNTSLSTWSASGSNTKNYKPTAAYQGDLLILTVDTQHSFFTSASGSCAGAPPPPPPPPPVNPGPQLLAYDPLFSIVQNERAGVLSLQSPDATDIFYQCDAWRMDKNVGYGDYTFSGEVPGEWLRGRKRFAPEVSISTASPILEAYYKDSWGMYYNQDVAYGLNIFVWFENLGRNDQ